MTGRPRSGKTVAQVIRQVATCTNCELVRNCRSPVPLTIPYMSPKSHHPSMRALSAATYMVVGEAPGRVEDHQNTPFIGPSGQFLRRALQRSGLDPSNGYYLNVVSCWPHGTPLPIHIKSCRGNLFDQLQCVDVKPVLVCGNVALSSIMPKVAMMNVAGRAIPVHGKIIYPVNHPAYVEFRASRDTQLNWQTQIDRFRLLVEGVDIDTAASCLYCNKSRVKGSQTCHKHDSLFAQDSYWKPASVQGELFE